MIIWPNEKFAVIKKKLWDIDRPDRHKKIKEITKQKTCSSTRYIRSENGNARNRKRKYTAKNERIHWRTLVVLKAELKSVQVKMNRK